MLNYKFWLVRSYRETIGDALSGQLYFEGVCGRATNVILAPSAGCKGFARRSVTSVPAPRRSKLSQIIRVPGSSVSIGMSCRNFACWLPKIGLLLGIFHAPRTENAPYGYERFGAPSENPPYGYARKKKKPSTDDGQLFIKVALRSNVFHRPNFASGPPLRLRSRPPDARDSATLFFALCVAWLLLCFAFAVASFGLAL